MIGKDGQKINKYSPNKANNQNRSQISQILEVFELLKTVELEKEKFLPNFIVTGEKGSGKTSFIEYITGLDLFPRSFYSKINGTSSNTTPIIKYELAYKHCGRLDNEYPDVQEFVDDSNILLAKEELQFPKTDNLISNILNEKNGRFGLKIILNNQLVFYSLNQFREHVNENSWPFDTNLTIIRIEIHDFSQEKKLNSDNDTENNFKFGTFDYNIFEMDINQMRNINNPKNKRILNNLENAAIILCHPSEKLNKLETALDIIVKVTESQTPVVVVFTKPENLNNFSQIVSLNKIIQSVNESRQENMIKTTFLRLRNNEDRREEVSKFYLKENIFYQSELLRNTSRKFGFYDISALLLEAVSLIFNKNFNEMKTMIEERLETCLKEFEDLGQTIPCETENKLQNLKFKLKKLINYLQNICEYYSDVMRYYIETEIHHIDNKNIEEFTKSSLLKQFKIIIDDAIPEYLKSSLIDFNKQMKIKHDFNFSEFQKSLNVITLKLVNEIDKSFTASIFEENVESSKKYLFLKINDVFKNTSGDFIDKVNFFFDSIFIAKESELKSNMKRSVEIELSHNININKSLFLELKNFYTEKIRKSEFKFNEDYQNFLSNYLEKSVKIRVNSLIEVYSKYFIYDFYYKIVDYFNDKSIDNVINQIVGQDIEVFKEKEEFKEKREILERSLNKLIKVLEIMTKWTGKPRSNVKEELPNTQDQVLNNSMGNSIYISKVSNLNTTVNKFLHKLSSINSNVEKFKLRLEKIKSVNPASIEEEEKFEEFEEVYENGNLNETEPNPNENYLLTSQIMLGEEYNLTTKEINLEADNPTNHQNYQIQDIDQQYVQDVQDDSPDLKNEEIKLIKFSKIKINDFNFTPARIGEEIIMIWDNTNSISVYNLKNNKLSHEYLNNIPGVSFLEDNRYLNIFNEVYIAGGSNANKIKQDKFMKLSRPSNTVSELKPVPIGVTRHSMIYLPTIKSILLLGGKDTRSTFIYSIPEDSWRFAAELKCERTDASMILVNQSLVLCLGGVKEKELRLNCFFIESLNIDDLTLNTQNTNMNAVYWREIAVKGLEELLTDLSSVSGFGSVILNDKSLILLGGYNISSLEDEEKAYTLSILNEELKEVELAQSKEIQSWFPESCFFELDYYNAVNFNVDGEVVKFHLVNWAIESLDCNYITPNN